MTTLLVDASNVIVRSLRAMERSGLSADGVPTGALHNFILTLASHIREEQATSVAVCWDGGRSVQRVAIDPNYKSHRTTQPEFEEIKDDAFGLAREFCSLAGVFHVGRPGFEADDIIAHYWRQGITRPPGEKLVILSSDKDFLQLLSEGSVEQVRLSSAGTPTDRWTEKRMLIDMGCKPSSYTHVLAIMGDVSDGVPGVRGMGPKTAVKKLSSYDWSLGEALRQDEKLKPHTQRVLTNLKLVDLRSPNPDLHLPPIPAFKPTTHGDALFKEFLAFLLKYRLNTVRDRLYANTLWQ